MPKLTDTQLILLSTAAQRADGNLLPAPDTLTADAGRITSAVAALIKRGLASAAEGSVAAGAVITNAGRLAIGVAVEHTSSGAADQLAPFPARQTKAALVLTLLDREQGATLAELVEATGWQAHTVRAGLTGLRKKGHAVDKRKRNEVTCYHVVATA